ncbi:hypothetical protein QBC32DRAFT_374021 [Pseudoneurospora amorphoporcata]|uniref:Uncharacterized protein n=1 Tax=Pseudoneurospora amorphoporcata TaxID=241081 RepID=A0AAN6NMX8_9PEZI|nr:hypothetical protein QBC32DRAFT_374021 [Pseudoneurospora amorphoporcata]
MYIENRTAGKAAQDLEPYLGDSPHYIKTSQQLLDHLKNEYYDHNRKQKAILEFNELAFKINQNFQEFWNAFKSKQKEKGKENSNNSKGLSSSSSSSSTFNKAKGFANSGSSSSSATKGSSSSHRPP